MSTTDSPSLARVLKDTASVTLADEFLRVEGTDEVLRRIMWHWRGDFFAFKDCVYERLNTDVLRARLHQFLRNVKVRGKKAGSIKVFQPEPRQVDNVLKTLASECLAPVDQMPGWVPSTFGDDAGTRPPAADCIAFANGILDYSRWITGNYGLLPSTPAWFSESVLPYDMNPGEACPAWMGFLASTLRKDGGVNVAAIALLQEWFGYCMTADTRHQKLMLMVGPPRCGKGTIIRALQRLIGQGNYAAPPFYSLAERFGLEALLGKRVATIPDAHLGRDADAVAVLDKLLQISGEDAITVDRKFKSAVPGVRLGVRFTIAANEPPDLPDASGAIVTRLLMLQFHESFVGNEDLSLDERLARETPGIAAWSLEGLKRLRKVGRFTDPEGAARMRNDYMRQTAPIHAFLQDRCDTGAGKEFWCEVGVMWEAWKQWTNANGHHAGSKEGLGKRLRAARPGITKRRVLRDGRQQYEYAGIKLRPEGELNFKEVDYDADAEPENVP